ncbi:50S ribosomal protein L23, partial [Candidatus Saccharibacteria bacterium]|nr:50S ribosomal protein L23 [Candidatus Saccharibacteria bacterium]
MNTLLVTPITTEKAYAQSLKNVYVFNVPVSANRNEIVKAIESQYSVRVVE